MNEIKKLVKISQYAGQRYDLVQASAGNSSVKLNNGEMLIKKSGSLLSEINGKSDCAIIRTNQVANILSDKKILLSQNKRERESIASNFVKRATIKNNNRPSIETLLHSILLKYTLHTHPLVVIILSIRKDWKKILKEIFNTDEISTIDYFTPGIDLAISLKEDLDQFDSIPNIIFLQNHGLIITSDNYIDIIHITEYVIEKIEKFLSIDMNRYKLTNKVTLLFEKVSKSFLLSYLSEDLFLTEVLKSKSELFDCGPCSPDTLVFCGYYPVRLKNEKDYLSIFEYKKKFNDLPKIIIIKNSILFVASTIKKAKEIEEVFKQHIISLFFNHDNINTLNKYELDYLANWESEKFRQKK